MATRNLFEPNPENLEIKLGFVNSLMSHFIFYDEVNFDIFLGIAVGVVVRFHLKCSTAISKKSDFTVNI